MAAAEMGSSAFCASRPYGAHRVLHTSCTLQRCFKLAMLSITHHKVYALVTTKRLLIAIAIALFLSVALLRYENNAWIKPQITIIEAEHPKIAYAEGLNVSLGISEWGKRGLSTKQMVLWAESLMSRSEDDVDEWASFQAALLQLFPFLSDTQNTIYTPWISPSNRSFSDDVGIVICAGSNNFHLAAHLIRNLRRVHGSKLPIEVAFAGVADLQSKHRDFLALEPNVTFINLLEYFPAARQDLEGSGWAMKPFALLASSHTRAILIDADAIFLTSPDHIFESNPDLNRTGLLLFHDRASGGRGEESLDWFKSQVESANITISSYLETQSLFYKGVATYEADSGVVAIDKSRPALLLGLFFATWMNTKQVREEVTYKLFHGDKETFWVAMELANVEYFFQPWYAGSIGKLNSDQTPEFDPSTTEVEICGKHMLHLDHTGQEPFWFNGGIYQDKGSPEQGFGELTHFWSGIHDMQPHWYWAEGNFACVKEKNVTLVPEHIMRNLNQTREQALEIDEMIRAL
jgi:alpha 1,3-mannosyltransferase